MSSEIESILGRVSGGGDLEMSEMSQVVGSIMKGQWSEDQIALLLNALRLKGETVEEIAGAAAALRAHMTPIRTQRRGCLDTCGTGGDGSGTFNISTAAALVAAAAGVPVAKHGNRGVTSRSGSADVLLELGVDINAPVERVESCLDELGICFCFAPQLHASMKHVAGARKKLGVPTVFNLIGPLCNPASAPFQLLGVGRPPLRDTLAAALRLLGTERALVVSGEDGLDEVTLGGVTHVSEVVAEGVQSFEWCPSDFGVAEAGPAALRARDPQESAAIIRGVFDGRPGPPRDVVVLNAAAALYVVGRADSPAECAAHAAAAIDSGGARDLLTRLGEATRS